MEITPARLSSIVPDSLKDESLDSSSINIDATVIEEATEEEISSSIIINFHEKKYGLYFSNMTCGSFKPGESYIGFVSSAQQQNN